MPAVTIPSDGRHLLGALLIVERRQPKAYAVHGLNDLRATSRGEFGADVADVAVDGAVRDVDVARIGGRNDAIAVEYDPWLDRERLQHRHLDRGKLNFLAAERHIEALGIDQQRPVTQCIVTVLRRGRRALTATQDRADPRHEFARTERLDHVIVSAKLNAEDAVNLLAA